MLWCNWRWKMTITEVSLIYGLSKDTLRYYEKVGLLDPVIKGDNGQRDYKEENLKQIEFIKCMRSVNIPISELTKYMDLFKMGDDTIKERRQILENQLSLIESQMKDLEMASEKLKTKIKLYDEQLLEKNLK